VDSLLVLQEIFDGDIAPERPPPSPADERSSGDEERRRRDLVRRAKGDDPRAMEELARHVLRIALRTAAAVLRDPEAARDVAQEVAIDALKAVRQLRDPGRLDAWVYRMSIRRAVRARDALSRKGQIETELDAAASVADSTEPAQIAAAEVRRAVAALPARQRAAIILRYVHDMTEAQVAEVLRCRPGTAGALLSRGRATLRDDPRLADLARELGIEGAP
jgi:RNA polymerase sigma-70 factor (ECF subfamily)